MKKILASLTAACMLLSMCALAACANGSEPETPSPEEPTTYTVTYAANEGTGTAPAAESYEEGKTFTVKENPFTREGYTFKGWNDGEKDVEAGSTYTMPAKDVTFSAQWEEITPQLCGIWTGSFEYYDKGTIYIKYLIMPGEDPYDYYIGGCGGSFGLEELNDTPLEWSGYVESETTPGLLECPGSHLQWSEEDKTLKYLYFEGKDTDKSFFMEYSPLPDLGPQTVEDGVYTLKDATGSPGLDELGDTVVLQDGKATMQYLNGAEEGQFKVVQIGNYSVLEVDYDYIFGFTLLPTEEGFMRVDADGGVYYYVRSEA